MKDQQTIEETEKEIAEEFSLFDSWDDKYEYIIDLGKKLSPLEDQYKIDENRVRGCQSTVWLVAEYREGKIFYKAESDAVIVKGLISMLIRVLSGYTPEEIMNKSIFSVKQDITLLSDNIVHLGGKKIKEIMDKKGIGAADVDYFLPHISSDFFRTRIYDMVEIYGGGIPYEKWFINLYTVGNVGAASIYLMINELFNSGKLKKGNRLLLLVPESARFSYMYAMLTVV